MMFILGNTFHSTSGSILSHLSKSATSTINRTNVRGSIIKNVSNPSIPTGESPNVTSNHVIKYNKVLVLSFDDNRIGDFTYAKPILDKYGFKANLLCNLW